jgi:D-alanyl-D-alanine carboxypeptidase
MLTLKLVKLPSTLRGIYGANKNMLGAAQLYAHPDLAKSIDDTEKAGLHLIYSDIFRSAKSSLEAMRKKPGLVQPPGNSAHNFGLAVDLDVDALMKELRLTKRQLDELLASFGLFCHRIDHALGAESWHYNALGDDPKKWLGFMRSSTANCIEQKIQALYGNQLRLTRDEVSRALDILGFLGVSRTTSDITEAIRRFQSQWDLVPDGDAGLKTQRLLAYLTAKTEVL